MKEKKPWSVGVVEVHKGIEWAWVMDDTGLAFILLLKEKAESVVAKHNAGL